MRATLLLLAALPCWSAELETLAELARSLAPEFAADALLRLAEAGKGNAALAEEAFRRAAGAQQPYPLSAPWDRFLDRAYSQGLDVLSLRCRAVRVLARADRRKARKLFLEIAKPHLPALACRDRLVPDLSVYYRTLTEVTTVEPVHAAGMQSLLEVRPVAEMLAAAGGDIEPLLGAFSAALQALSGDARSFGVALQGLGPAVAALARRQPGDTHAVEAAYRAFLVRHLRGPRCALTDLPGTATFGLNQRTQDDADPVGFFNQVVRTESMAAITAEEAAPEMTEPAPEAPRSCESAECRRAFAEYRALLFTPEGTVFGPEARAGAEWQGRLKEFLALLGRVEMEFPNKCRLFSDLINVVPNGVDRENALRAFQSYLETAGHERRSEWFLPVSSLIGRVSLDPLGLAGILRELADSRHPVIALYARLEQAFPRSVESRLGGM